MKSLIRIIAISLLFVAAASAVTPQPKTGSFDWIPFCRPSNPNCQ